MWRIQKPINLMLKFDTLLHRLSKIEWAGQRLA